MIVIDVGNSNIVFGLYSKDKLIKVLRLKTEKKINKKNKILENFFSSKKNLLNNIENKYCILSSVVPSLNEIFKKYFHKNKFKFYIINPKKIPFKGKIKYNLNQIGSDRIANYAYAFKNNIKNCIIIDFGTATTFDVIKNKNYSGGLIFPGINLSMDTLIKNAELIKHTKISKSNQIVNNNTSASIKSGFYFGYLHAINGLLHQIIRENKFNPKIYLTGGLGRIFKDKINFNPIYIEYLTIEGIRIIGKQIYNEK